ncbi:MAG: dethiobiotin synthase [Thermodesulfobacteriota bacterium]|nr:MAG: dethiobiotin synthase [Thermodesulfobacteriota bacterium]
MFFEMRKNFFITGTDTGVGKTFVAAAFVEALRKAGFDVGVMKPVETGCAESGGELVPGDALKLKEAARTSDPLDLINPYRFAAPVAPCVAASMEDREIEIDKIAEAFNVLSKRHDFMVVEGAGGLMVPLTPTKTFIDLLSILKIPVIIVAPSRLGVINHTLLTVEAARRGGIDVAGIILNNPALSRGSDLSGETNAEVIERFSGAPLLAELPFIKEKPPYKYVRGFVEQLTSGG